MPARTIRIAGIAPSWFMNVRDTSGLPDTFTVDHWRCRFVSDAGESSAVSHAQIISLLQRLDAHGLDVIKTENLYNFDGTRGYSA
jgi:isocitrate dehydrogenase